MRGVGCGGREMAFEGRCVKARRMTTAPEADGERHAFVPVWPSPHQMGAGVGPRDRCRLKAHGRVGGKRKPRQTAETRSVRRGRHAKLRQKPLRAERRMSGVFVVTPLVCFFYFARETADAFWHPAFRAPSIFEGDDAKRTTARPRLKEQGGCFTS